MTTYDGVREPNRWQAAMCRERARKQAEARQARRPKAQEALRRVGPGRLQRAAAMGPVVHELLRSRAPAAAFGDG